MTPTEAEREAERIVVTHTAKDVHPGAGYWVVLDRTAMTNAIASALAAARAQALADCAARAREIAEMYDQSSDGRNTFILFAEWAEARDLKEPGHGK